MRLGLLLICLSVLSLSLKFEDDSYVGYKRVKLCGVSDLTGNIRRLVEWSTDSASGENNNKISTVHTSYYYNVRHMLTARKDSTHHYDRTTGKAEKFTSYYEYRYKNDQLRQKVRDPYSENGEVISTYAYDSLGRRKEVRTRVMFKGKIKEEAVLKRRYRENGRVLESEFGHYKGELNYFEVEHNGKNVLDDQGRVIEEWTSDWYKIPNKLTLRAKVDYTVDDLVVVTVFEDKGKLEFTYKMWHNGAGRIIKETTEKPSKERTTITHTYTDLDTHGNYLKETVNTNGAIKVLHRRIEYY